MQNLVMNMKLSAQQCKNKYMNTDQRIKMLEAQVIDQQRLILELQNNMQDITKFNNSTKFYFKDQVFFDKEGKVGFFGKDPVRQQTLASDTLANLLIALRNLGLIS